MRGVAPLENFLRKFSMMRLPHLSGTVLSIALSTLLSTMPAVAGPYPKDASHNAGFFYLFGRTCASYCGADNQYCCGSGEACYTNQANIAFCSANGDSVAGGYAVYTTTYTETNLVLITSTYTSSWGAATPHSPQGPVVTSPAICTTSLGESSCGNICCASNQRCAVANSCTAYSSVFLQPTKSTTYSAPVRPTSGGLFTISATTTVPFQAPATASGSTLPMASEESNLSGGAVAGIVVGVIAGILFLLLICFFCVVRKGCSGALAAFGLGKKDRRPKDRYTSRPHTPTSEKKKSSSKFLTALGAILVGATAVLGLQKLKKGRDDESSSTDSSQISSGYYSDSYTGSRISTITDDRQTRDTRQTAR
ncbi:hypothetical protein K3495_g6582 [Podosphaera aphanis]|nr:hypothetical protein K3495_g6582 [Podosphaera aphanis]